MIHLELSLSRRGAGTADFCPPLQAHIKCWLGYGATFTLIHTHGRENCTITLVNHLQYFFKAKHIRTIQPSHSIPRYSSKINESICPDKILYTKIHIYFICSSQNLETTQISIKRYMDKETMVYPYSEYYLAI